MIERRLPVSRLPQSRLEYAIGLATIAEYLVLTQPAAVATSQHLTITRHPGAHGIMVWEAERGRCMLHVDTHGRVWHYRPGPWEGHLYNLLPGVRHTWHTLALLVDGATLRQAAAWREQHGPPYNPLEALGCLGLRAAQDGPQEEDPCIA